MMATQFRLDSLSTAVASAFRQASSDKRRQAALLAVGIAAEASGLERQEEVAGALSLLRDGGAPSASMKQRVEELAATFDDVYLDLADKTGNSASSEVLQSFGRARAAAALSFALSEDAAKLHEAIYEAALAVEDNASLLAAIEASLR